MTTISIASLDESAQFDDDITQTSSRLANYTSVLLKRKQENVPVVQVFPMLLALFAIVHEVDPGPHGVPLYVITCGRWDAACYSRAMQICPDGYEVVLTDIPGMARQVGNGAVAVAPLHVLAIECR